MSWLCLWPSLAGAHPVGGVYPSHQLELELKADGLRAVYSARIPTHEVVLELEELREAGDPLAEDAQAFSDRKMDELRDNLALQVDGQAVAWERREDEAQGNSKYLYYDQVLWLPLEPGPHELALRNGNMPDQVSYFMVTMQVDPVWVVEQTSLLYFDEGELKRNRDGRWRMDEQARELSLVLREATWTEALQRDEGLMLSTVEALPPERGAAPWLVGGLVLVLVAGAGLALRRGAPSA